MLELILDIILLVFFGYTFFFHVLEAPVPAKVARNPYYLQPDIWPKTILALLMILLVINIVKIILKNKGKEEFKLSNFVKSVPEFFKSKIFLGIVIVVAASFLLEPLGFMVTTLFVLLAYGYLLGGAKLTWKLPVIALVVAGFLYVSFGVWLQVNLPRGTVPFLRDFALFLESIV